MYARVVLHLQIGSSCLHARCPRGGTILVEPEDLGLSATTADRINAWQLAAAEARSRGETLGGTAAFENEGLEIAKEMRRQLPPSTQVVYVGAHSANLFDLYYLMEADGSARMVRPEEGRA